VIVMSERFVLVGVPVHLRAGRPPVEALGVEGGRVAAAGLLDEVRAAVPSATEVRLDGGAVLPAFVDAHQHAYLVAADPSTDLLHRRAADMAGLVDVIAELVAAEGPRTGWARFHGYEPLRLAERRSPVATELDRAVPDRPLHVLSRTFHESVVNSAGLDALAIGRGTPDPDGGRIVRDRRGNATGVLLEAASFAAEARSRRSDDLGSWRTRLEAHGRLLLSHGITRIGDAAVPHDVAADVVAVLDSVGVSAHPLLIGARIDTPAYAPGATAKVLADGGEYCHLCFTRRQLMAMLGSAIRAGASADRRISRAVARRTGAVRREPDGYWHSGISFPEGRDFAAALRAAAQAGSAVAVHAVGNGAVATVLDALAADPGLAQAVPLRVEHAMALDPDLMRRLGERRMAVVGQPGFISAFGHELEVVPVPVPLELMAFRSMLDGGVELAFGSDYPAASLDPWVGIADAVRRCDSAGIVRRPHQRIELAEAIEASTRTAAAVLGVEGGGTLEPGSTADLVWWPEDPFRGEVTALPGLRARATWREGRLVHAVPASGLVVDREA
jgi:predicted amidohydrolase YtcJ